MYKLKADGVVFYDPASDDMTLQVLSPRASFELNKPGTLDFTLLPGNVVYNSLHKMKTVITLEYDDEIVFCGRVLETTSDLYNQKEVYCEGELGFLLDTIQRPYKFTGKPADLFAKLLTAHNEQAEDFKRFEPGIVTAIEDNEEITVNGEAFSDTMSEIQSLLLDEHGGYLRVRRENGVRYLDYVSSFDQPCSQTIDFGVNLVDIENKVNTQDVCTVLIPVGKMVNGEYTNIRVANDGKDYIEDTEGVAKYGRIVKTYTWDEVIDPVQLKELALKYMATLKAQNTLTISAVDLGICGVDVDRIHLGDTVHLHSVPHGLDKDEVCTGIELDIEKPEKSEYTFGLPQETFTDSNANTVANFNSLLLHQHRWLTETDDALTIAVEKVNLIGHRTTQLEIDVDAAEAAITLKASQDDVNILKEKHTEVELRLDAAEDSITAQAATISLQAEEIKAKADKIDLQGYVTMSEFETVQGWAQDFVGVTVSASNVTAGEGDFDEMWVGQLNGQSPTWTTKEVVTGVDYYLETATTPPFYNANGTQVSAGITYVKNVVITPKKEMITYLGTQ